jgi:hypothetical protein
MKTEKTKEKANKTRCQDFSSSTSNFQGMSEMMSKCFTGQGKFPDCSSIMKNMLETCCGQGKKDTKTGGRKQ